MIIVRVFVVLTVMALDCTWTFNPCEPSPCGTNSQCYVVNEHAVCTCRAGYLGAPPACRPECAYDSDCRECAKDSDCHYHKACIRSKCRDPCAFSCGFDARCDVVRHMPICSCPENLPDGNPFTRCSRENKTAILRILDEYVNVTSHHNTTNDETSERVGSNVVLLSLVILLSIAVVLGFFIIIYMKKCRRAKANIEEPTQVYIPHNRFYVNLLFRKECQREIYEREHIYEQVN